jgi:hypothetical protein
MQILMLFHFPMFTGAAMQSDSESDSVPSSEDDECLTVTQFTEGAIGGYMFEPIRDPSNVSSESSDGSNTTDTENYADEEQQQNRLSKPVEEWCRCGHCSKDHLVNEKEAVCCSEIRNAHSKIENSE